MEKIWDILDEELNKKDEVIGIHANAIVDKNIASPREINKRMDALCMDEEIGKGILWESLYKEIKPKLQATKEVLDMEDDNKIKKLSEFRIFLQNYVTEKRRISTIDIMVDKKATKEKIKEMPLPEELQKEKDELNSIEKAIRKTITESEEKSRWGHTPFGNIVKKSKYLNDTEKEETKKLLSDFMNGEYILEFIRQKISEKKKKLNDKIAKYRIKKIQKAEKETTKKNKNTQEKKIDIETYYDEQEILKLFRENKEEIQKLKQRFYLPEDNKSIQYIQEYFKKNMKDTISSPDIEKIIINNTIKWSALKKKWNNIYVNTNEYREIKNRIQWFEKKFIKGENGNTRDPKEYLFDRLVEYIGKDILEYKIEQNKGKHTWLPFENFKIYKTDTLDDTFGGADYMVIYKYKNEGRTRIFPIDLFISDKEEKETDTIYEKWSLKEKIEKGKEPKIPYSTYIKLFMESDQKNYEMKTTTRYIEQQPTALTYSIIKEVLENNEKIPDLVKNFDIKSPLYDKIKNHKDRQKIDEYINKNIIKEIEKKAA